MADFNTYLDKIDMDFWRELCAEKGKLCLYKKGDYFLHCGDTTNNVWGFIKKGYFKYSVTDSEGNAHITGFSFCDTPLGDYSSLVLRTPAVTDIIAATDAEVWVCNRNIVDELFEEDSQLHSVISDGFFHQTYDRFLNLYRRSAKERYIQILACCPDILQNITLKEFASYLQITPTYLSRIRKEITFSKK